jgi:hypothetical protein
MGSAAPAFRAPWSGAERVWHGVRRALMTATRVPGAGQDRRGANADGRGRGHSERVLGNSWARASI